MKKQTFDIVLRSKITGEVIRTQCDSYAYEGCLRNFLEKHSDKIEIVVLDPAWGDFIPWNTLVSCL